VKCEFLLTAIEATTMLQSNWRRHVITLTSDFFLPLNGVTGHPCHGLLIFILLCPSVLDLRSGTGQTDGQTDNGHHCIMLPPYGTGHNNSNKKTLRETQTLRARWL